MNESLQKILELDLRHNELLDRLTDLDAKIQAVLEEWTSGNITDQISQSEPHTE